MEEEHGEFGNLRLVQYGDEIDDPEFLNFAVENISELFGYLATGRVNIRLHRDITGEMWFGVGQI